MICQMRHSVKRSVRLDQTHAFRMDDRKGLCLLLRTRKPTGRVLPQSALLPLPHPSRHLVGRREQEVAFGHVNLPVRTRPRVDASQPASVQGAHVVRRKALILPRPGPSCARSHRAARRIHVAPFLVPTGFRRGCATPDHAIRVRTRPPARMHGSDQPWGSVRTEECRVKCRRSSFLRTLTPPFLKA